MTSLTDTIFAYLGMSVFGAVGFLFFFNLIRVYRYGKLVHRIGPVYENNDKAYAKFSMIFGISFNTLFTLSLAYFGLIWIGFQIAFFYWYWHTKEDPLNRFHYEQKIWEDPRDKKKKEAK